MRIYEHGPIFFRSRWVGVAVSGGDSRKGHSLMPFKLIDDLPVCVCGVPEDDGFLSGR